MDAPSNRQCLDDYVASYARIAHFGVTNNVDTDPATTTQGPITDPERRHAPTTLTPWTDGSDVLDDIFLCLRMLEATDSTEVGDSSTRTRFPSRDHVEETGSELPVINSEAAVHFFDYDTIYKPAKKIIDSALARSTALRNTISAILRRRHYNASTNVSTNGMGQVVFSPHSRTITVPTYMVGQKRKRSRSESQAPCSGSESEEYTSTEAYESQGIMDEIQLSVDQLSPDHSGKRERAVHERAVHLKSGPGDFYCSFVSNKNPKSNSIPPSSHLLLVGEAKAPHKLTRHLIQHALGENNVTIDTRQFIQAPERYSHSGSNSPSPSLADINARGSGGSTDYDDDQRWLAAVATQIYSSLLNKRLRYGYITTGESYILVRIRPVEATTLEYLLLPTLRRQSPQEVEGRDPAWLDWLPATPLSRMSSLALLSLFGDGQLTETEVAQAKAAIPAMIWKTPQHREQSLGTGSFMSTASAQTRGSDPEWTERGGQSRKRARDVGDADDGTTYSSRHEHKRPCIMTSDTDDGQQYTRPTTTPRSIPPPAPLTPPLEAKREETDLSMDKVPFCSSRCLHSLTVPEVTTDPLCPNWTIHAQTDQRPTSAAQLRSLARTCVSLPAYMQGDCNTRHDPPVLLDHGTENAVYMGYYGASSVVFKVRIGGYVLAAKAARSVHPMMDGKGLQRLRLEDAAYKRLHTLQGHGVPVCLGLVDGLPLQIGRAGRGSAHAASGIAHFSGFLLLSWAGPSLLHTCIDVDADQERTWLARLRTDMGHLLSQIHGLGILHGDAELRNVVVTSDGGDYAPTVSLVDFERAVTKGRFARRLARDDKGVDEKDADQRFQQACQREKMLCLEQWDTWAERRLRTP